MNSPAVWYLSRATGVVSLVLFTGVFGLGTLLAGGRSVTGVRSTVLHRLHRSLSLGSLVFLAVHILSSILDTYVSISWWAAVLPFASSYRTLSVTLGTLASDLLLVVVITSVLRHRIPENTWRVVHYAAYAMWPIAVLHGIVMSTSDAGILRELSIACAVVGGLLVLWRLVRPHPHARRARQAPTEEWS